MRGGSVGAEQRWAEAWLQRERLLRIARHRVPTREDAEDVVAEAIQRAGAQADLPVDAVPAWLTRVTINLCVDRQRRLATQRAALSRAELRPEPAPSHEDEIAVRAQAKWAARLLDELPARQALALRMKADGLDNGEIARRLAVTTATVEGLIKRSRAAMRHALSAAGAVIAAAWAATVGTRRPVVVVAAAAVAVFATLLPWVDPQDAPAPRAPERALQAPALPVVEAQQGAAQRGVSPAVPSRVPASAQEPVPSRLGLGRAIPYDGPRCLAAYCLPIVDEFADQSLGATAPQGWAPADLHHYLGEPTWSDTTADRRPLVAIVGWYDFPWLADDLAVYRRTFRLPPCTEADGCLQVLRAAADDDVQEQAITTGLGAFHSTTPRTAGLFYSGNPGGEQAQMLQGVSAVCPECRLALVVADTDSVPDLVHAFRLAQSISPDVVVTNLSLGTSPDRSIAPLEDARLYDGALVVAAAGVGGFTPGPGEVPRRFPNVVTVGGTVVGEGGRVIADEDNASFCNATVAQPAWQRSSDTGCRGRAGVDLVLPAGEATGLSVYITGGLQDGRGWYHPGHGTQAAAIFGGLLARHNLTATVRGPGDLYAHPEWFADITGGSTDCMHQGCTYDQSNPGQTCRPSERQLCDARRGWDGATGLGEPRYLPWR